jgi:magnesium transporter
MLTFQIPGERTVTTADLAKCQDLTRRAVWIDLLDPTREEELAVEAALGEEIPTRDEMNSLEPSSRLYQDRAGLFMTATLPVRSDASGLQSSAVSFILTPERLVTLRYGTPVAFPVFAARRDAKPDEYDTALKVFTGMLDAVVEQLAEVLEKTGAGIEQFSLELLGAGRIEEKTRRRAARPLQTDFQRILRGIGLHSDLASHARESIVSVSRIVPFYRELAKTDARLAPASPHLKSIGEDLASLGDHATFLSSKVSFLLDATLGLINNEQNGIIKIVSVAAVVFLPPTLVASIYGMNFQHMPELGWRLGYPMALAMMVVSAILPYALFRRKGWL